MLFECYLHFIYVWRNSQHKLKKMQCYTGIILPLTNQIVSVIGNLLNYFSITDIVQENIHSDEVLPEIK